MASVQPRVEEGIVIACDIEICVERARWLRNEHNGQMVEVQLVLHADEGYADLTVLCPIEQSALFWAGRTFTVNVLDMARNGGINGEQTG
jgi:hypothetical protein